ncbi:MAG: TlpA disulfide reductase family protein [Candidatus Pedobacter colombiensis]|uniref:TlpA disulfide reductase family protein n=1 Tax=Candidatus Pedobacter colombiensis TaxID=3121371 RepID=A0AAJ5W5L3_9SPHI|nr:TlpA disulfide reductase family protein [Pedobacter sp.]WEK18983.1 MAG: TlpA disulfide reductase family protein [Pedobacter sp.]
MKNIILFISGILLCLSAKAQTDSITISGVLKGLSNRKLGISWTGSDDAKSGYVTAQGNGDHFSVRVPVQDMPVAAKLYVHPVQGQMNESSSGPKPPFDFFLLNTDIVLNGAADSPGTIHLKGDDENERYNQLLLQMAPTEQKQRQMLDKLWDSAIKRSPVDSAKLSEEIMALYRENVKKEKAFVKANPDAFASLFILSRTANSYSADEYLATWKALKPTYKNTVVGRAVARIAEKLSVTQSGTPVFAFERLDKEGNKVSPELMKGSAYILDFWGSWCAPCRASHPHLKELYKKYKSKGFEIIAIAQERGKTLEESKKAWSKAIKEDDVNWVHILNQDGIAQQDIVKTFSVNGFPTKILVGADGKIITRVTAGVSDAIDKALEKIYGF